MIRMRNLRSESKEYSKAGIIKNILRIQILRKQKKIFKEKENRKQISRMRILLKTHKKYRIQQCNYVHVLHRLDLVFQKYRLLELKSRTICTDFTTNGIVGKNKTKLYNFARILCH